MLQNNVTRIRLCFKGDHLSHFIDPMTLIFSWSDSFLELMTLMSGIPVTAMSEWALWPTGNLSRWWGRPKVAEGSVKSYVPSGCLFPVEDKKDW